MEQNARFRTVMVVTGSCCPASFFRVKHSACMLDAADSTVTSVSTIQNDCVKSQNITFFNEYIILRTFYRNIIQI